MVQVRFFDQARNEDLKYAVIAAREDGKWLLCRRRGARTWELPGGHREPGEHIYDAARRELWEETGATDFQLESVSAYAVDQDGETSYGGLFFAELRDRGELPPGFEIEEVRLMEAMPAEMSYPEIQPALLAQVERWLAQGGFRDDWEDLLEYLC